MSPRSTDANLSRRFIRESCECSTAGRIHHIVLCPSGASTASPILYSDNAVPWFEEDKHVGGHLGMGSG